MRMSREAAEAALRERTEDYLTTRRGVVIKGRYANGTSHPFICISPGHADKTPSMFYSYSNHCAICRTCGAKYGIFDLIGEDYHLPDFPSQFQKAAEIYGIEIEKDTPRRNAPERKKSEMQGTTQDKKAQVQSSNAGTTHTQKIHTSSSSEDNKTGYYKACRERISQTEYPALRGLSAGILDRHYIGYDPAFKTRSAAGEYAQWQALIIPTGKGSYAARNTDPKAGKGDRYRKRGAAQIFGYKALYSSSSPIFITEGEIDAMSIEEAGGAAVGLGSYDNVDIFLRLLDDKKPSQMLVIALDEEEDPDKQERVTKAEEKLSEGLRKRGISYTIYHPYGAYKDANEALCSDREAFTAAIKKAEDMADEAEKKAREKYLSSSAGNHLQEFIDGISASVDTEAIPTGFSTLDAILDGGLYEGLITVGGISSLGKTSLIMQIADHVAASGTDVLIMSLEMARNELMSKSISRHTLQLTLQRKGDIRNAKTARGITAGRRYSNYSRAELQLIQDSIKAYGEYAQHIFISEGVGDITVDTIRETVRKHILYTGGKLLIDDNGKESIQGGRRPLLVVDYLQIVAPQNERATDKQNTDKAVIELKRISRDYKIPVIAISSFNRTGYKESVTFECFKESGAIEYSSDTVIGLQLKGAGEPDFNSTKEKKRNPREIELVILKNRQGQVGDKVSLVYYPMFNYFKEE